MIGSDGRRTRDSGDEACSLNRKNALCAGSDGGVQNWATIALLIQTCKLNDSDPNAWMVDALAKIVNGQLNSEIDELL